jgi:peptide/nickel transport system substrate-binding protein
LWSRLSPSNTASGGITVGSSPQSSPNWLFPVFSLTDYSDLNTHVASLLYEPLLYINKQDPVDFSRSIDSSITPSHNDTGYTIKLGTKYRWSNGTPVSAYDVVFT